MTESATSTTPEHDHDSITDLNDNPEVSGSQESAGVDDTADSSDTSASRDALDESLNAHEDPVGFVVGRW